MSCDFFEKYEMGEVRKSVFKKHVKKCLECQEILAWDKKIMAEAKSLRRPIETSHLWERIEKSLKSELKPELKPQGRRFIFQPFFALRYSVPFLFLVFLLFFFLWNPLKHDSGLLTQRTLQKIEGKEMSYIEAIRELEKLALPKMPGLDLELMLLYRERLETIDEQIIMCKEAIEENPANAHIRRYMLAALQDKKQTLMELIEVDNTT
jgi:hypothetical protein